jgi:hypothetical protein
MNEVALQHGDSPWIFILWCYLRTATGMSPR